MSGAQFFAGIVAGMAMLAVPAVIFLSPIDVPRQIGAWLEPTAARSFAEQEPAALARPKRGATGAEPVPTPAPVPTLEPARVPTQRPAPPQPAASANGLPAGWSTGTVRSGGAGVTVRRAVNVNSPSDPFLPEGAPVLLSPSGVMRVDGQEWRSVRALNNVVGWVPANLVAVDSAPPAYAAGQAAVKVAGVQAPGAPPTGAQSPAAAQLAAGGRMRVARTDGEGVILRATPRMEDRTTRGLLDGATVTLVEQAGADWARVRADNGLEGWVPLYYLDPAG